MAWPDMWVNQTNAWYDPILAFLGFSKRKRYKVGHAAGALINHKTGDLHYFDFGRYEAPPGKGRIRDHVTDPLTKITTKALINKANEITNLDAILLEIAANRNTNGRGKLIANLYTGICFQTAFKEVKTWQALNPHSYGPFVKPGTNCSRFVNQLIKLGKPDFITYLLLTFPYTITPSPILNVRIARNKNVYYRVVKRQFEEIQLSLFKRIY